MARPGLGAVIYGKNGFSQIRGAGADVLLPITRHPPYGSQSQNHEEEQLFCGLQFAPGSSQSREGGDEAAAELGPNSWRVPEGNGLQGEAAGFVHGYAALSCPSPSPLLGWR